MANGCITEEDMCANVDYLVLGHFKRKEGDTKGTHTMLWLALDNSAAVEGPPAGRARAASRPCAGQVC